MAGQKTLVTADDLLRMGDTQGHYELVRGEMVEMAPAGGRHGRVAIRIARRVLNHVEQHDLGEVFAAETGFRIEHDPDTVRAPDVAFVFKGRLPGGEVPLGFLDLAPDLVVEVVSPGDTASGVQAKVEDWLRAGVRLAWIVYPDTRSVTVYRALSDVKVLTERDVLDGEPVLPGFTCPVRDLF